MFAKKNLVAAAALLAVAGAAQAQSSVKLYGTVDVSVGSFEDAHEKGAKARTTAVESGKLITSFIGLSGSEDLGGGLKAEFALESFLAADNGKTVSNLAGGFWGRGSFVALNSSTLGKVALGQYDNPLFTSAYTYNPFGSSFGFSPTIRHLYGSALSLGFDTGWVNSITYESLNYSGFSAVAQYALKENSAATSKNSYALSGTYAAGPFSATLTYEKGGNTSVANGTATYTQTAYFADQKVWNLGASYDFGVVKAFGQYTQVKTSAALDLTVNGSGVVTAADIATGLDYKDKIFQLGVSVPVTDKAAVLVSFGQKKSSDGAGSPSTKDELFAVGYDYNLSKRTDVYGVFTNNRQSTLVSGQTFAVGLRHSF